MLDLCCCLGFSLGVVGGATVVVVCGLLIGVAFLVAGQGHQGSRAPVIAACGR